MPARPATAATAVFDPERGLRIARALGAALLVTLLAGAGESWAATARVQYVSAASVYLDQGLAAGLTEGAAVTVKRDGKEIARLTVTFVAEHSAACAIESSTETVRAGDVALFSPVAAPDSSAAASSAPDSTAATSPAGSNLWPGGGRVHGRVTSLYTSTKDPGGTYRNPSLLADLRWSGRGLGQMTLRGRATRPSIRAVTDLPNVEVRESKLRVYEVAAGYRSAAGRVEMEAGRILPKRLEGIGYTDGAALHWRPGTTLRFGLAGGRAANLATAGFASGGYQLGGYVETGSAAIDARHRWRAMVGAAFTSDSTGTRRQYLVEQADRSGADAGLFQSVEVDLNPGWKRSLGEPAIGWTAWSLGANAWMRRRVSVTLSADSRRAVLVPEQAAILTTVPLDRYTGGHASARVRIAGPTALRIGGDLRRRDRDHEIFTSWDAGLTGGRLVLKGLTGGLHVMGYRADRTSGVNADANLVARIASFSQVDLSGGWSGADTDPGFTAPSSYRSRWVRAGIDYRTPGGLAAAITHEWRSGGPGNELAAELGLSF